MTIYQKMIELSEPRNQVMMALFACAFGILLIHTAIETSPIPFLKTNIIKIRSVYWTCVLLAYLIFAAYLLILFNPWS
jgi:hypothetical protein